MSLSWSEGVLVFGRGLLSVCVVLGAVLTSTTQAVSQLLTPRLGF